MVDTSHRSSRRLDSIQRWRTGQKARGFLLVAGLLFIAAGGQLARAESPLRVSDYGDLQAAIDVAEPGDTVLVDIDTPGALLDKRLTIKGLPRHSEGGTIHAEIVFPSVIKAALALTPGASGSEILNVRMDGASGIASVGSAVDPVDHVTVRGCTIVAADAAVFLNAIGGSGWIIEHNSIRLEHRSDFQQPFAAGVYLRLQNDARVAHNEISGFLTRGTFMSSSSGGVVILGGNGIEVVQNEVSVNAGGPPIPWTIEAVIIQATSTGVDGITVAMNDFAGSVSSFGPYGVTYVGTLDEESDVTGLGLFDHFESPSPPARNLAIAGNFSSGGGTPGDSAGSSTPPGDLLRP